MLYNSVVVNLFFPTGPAAPIGETRYFTMERKVGTVSRGIRGPIIREGDDLAKIVVDSVLDAAQSEGYELRDGS